MTGRSGGLRVLIGAESLLDAEPAFRLIDRLSARDIAELGGLLLQAAELATTPRLARQRVVTPAGVLAPLPSASSASAWLASDANRFRTQLAAVAGARQWRVDVEQRDLDHIADFTRGWDVFVLGCRLTHRLPGRVVLVSGEPVPEGETARFARDIARSAGADLTVLANDDRLPARLTRLPMAAVILDCATAPLPEPSRLRAIVDSARCPVIVMQGPSG